MGKQREGEQCFSLGRAYLKFGESYEFCPHLKFQTYCGLGVGQSCQVSQMRAGQISVERMGVQVPTAYECFLEAVETGVLVKLQTYPGLDLSTSGQQATQARVRTVISYHQNISLARFWVTRGLFGALFNIGSRSINVFGSLELNFQDLSNFTNLYS